MIFQLKLLVCFLLLVTLTLPVSAISLQKDKEKEQRQELEKKTLALLNDVAAGAWSLKLPENRLLIMSGAADLLWSFDEKRARTLYWDALNSLNLIVPPSRSTAQKLSKEEWLKLVQSYLSAFELRQKLLRQIARKDPKLALDMLRATRLVPPRQSTTDFQLPDDLQLEQGIASEAVAHDAALALQIGRQSLAKGLTFEVIDLLQRLNEKDSGKASQFAGDIVVKLRTANMASDFYAPIIAVHLLQASRTPELEQEARLVSAGGSAKILPLTDEQKRDVVEVLSNAALSSSVGSRVLSHISEVMPEIDQVFPERRAAIANKLAAFNGTLGPADRVQGTYNSLIRTGSLEELVRMAAGAADSSTRMMLYQQASIIAIGQGKTDWFREVLRKQIPDADERANVIDVLDSEEISTAAARKQHDRLETLLPRIRRKEERARAMVELALLLKEKKENEAAAAMLDEAATLITTDLKDEKESNALLTLLCAYALIDPPKAFALAERAVDRANGQISLLLLLDRFVRSGAVKKNEILLEQPGLMPLDLLVFRYGKGVAALAKADFSRTRALAERFERNELKLMAQLLLLKGLLEPGSSFATR